MKKTARRRLEVWADWADLTQPTLMGLLYVTPSRGQEIFSFEYDLSWLGSPQAQVLDPSLGLYRGQQYAPDSQENFGVFLDSAPDRWGRVLMRRREAQAAWDEAREARTLLESDYLLGVFDEHRMGALRYKEEAQGPFLDDKTEMASPPWTTLRELEHASLQLEGDGAEKHPDYVQWLRLLIAPGGSLGGARPKASVIDRHSGLWIAKFPSRNDDCDVGGWEYVVHKLAIHAGIETAEAKSQTFGSQHRTFLSRRFDRTKNRSRIHFASAMTLLQRKNGDDASTGVSYLELAEFLIQRGASTEKDLEQLWRRIVFFVCISNVDDHLRNHGFVLGPSGWRLAPAYDMNPSETGNGLKLNISESDNSQDLDLTRNVAKYFRLNPQRAEEIIEHVTETVTHWRKVAAAQRISSDEQDRMAPAFRVACGGR